MPYPDVVLPVVVVDGSLVAAGSGVTGAKTRKRVVVRRFSVPATLLTVDPDGPARSVIRVRDSREFRRELQNGFQKLVESGELVVDSPVGVAAATLPSHRGYRDATSLLHGMLKAASERPPAVAAAWAEQAIREAHHYLMGLIWEPPPRDQPSDPELETEVHRILADIRDHPVPRPRIPRRRRRRYRRSGGGAPNPIYTAARAGSPGLGKRA